MKTDPLSPLLDTSPLPRFDAIKPEHVAPGIHALLAELGSQLDTLERDATPTWSGLVEPLERIDDEFSYRWRIVTHLMGVSDSDALRAAYSAVEPHLVRFSMRINQSRPVYSALCSLRDGPAWDRLDPAQQHIVALLIRDARLAGVGLEGAERNRFNEIQTELAGLSTSFSNHVLDATKIFSLTLRERADVDGLPASALQLAAQSARAAGEPDATPDAGPWRITLDHPSVDPFMKHSRRRDLRERLFRAYITRASSGELDNTPLIQRTLHLRQHAARLLGYSTWAELSLSTKMASGVDAVERLLEELRTISFDVAHGELQELNAFARAHPELEADPPKGERALAHWDLAFWTERLREDRYAYTAEELRPYFPLPRVLDGLFGLTQRLFGVRIQAADGEVPTWHPDVRFFRVLGDDGRQLAAFYLDPYSRPSEKRGGAWMNECTGRSRLFRDAQGGLRRPVAYLVCNQSPPIDGRPSLMRFREVETLFHEFGHALQHMLTRVEYGLASGIHGVERDAVELPSQFMENWCYDRETIHGLSGHHETGESLPDALFEKIRVARTFRAATAMLRQLLFACTDMELHHRYDPDGERTPIDVHRRVAERTSVLPVLPEHQFLCSFDHIFADGYSAGYYAYKWAEVLSADAFAAFEEAGLEDEAAVVATGRRFRDTVLALGGSRPAMDVFVAFRGREPMTEPLLRHAGLTAAGSTALPP